MKEFIALFIVVAAIAVRADTNIVITLTDAEFADLPLLNITTNQVSNRLIAQIVVKRTVAERKRALDRARINRAAVLLQNSTNSILKSNVLEQIEADAP